MLTAQQESSLVSGGDCFEHWHSSDRARTHSDLEQLQQLASVVTVTSDFTVRTGTDFVLADTSLSDLTVTLPRSADGVEMEVVKVATPNILTIALTGADLIYGQSSVLVYNIATALRFKSITGGWILI